MESHRPSGGRGPKRRRLSRSAEFERVYRQGRSKGNRFLVLYAFPREDDADDDGPRLGLSVSRSVGGAVDRTRVKRVLREAFWEEAERLPGRLGLRRRRPARSRSSSPSARASTACAPRWRSSSTTSAAAVAGGGVTRAAHRGDRADPRLPAADLAGAAAALQVPPDLLGLRGAGDPSPTAYCAARCSRRGGCCAATRSATAGTTRFRPDPLPRGPSITPVDSILSSRNILQPLIDVFEGILVFVPRRARARLGLVDHRA